MEEFEKKGESSSNVATMEPQSLMQKKKPKHRNQLILGIPKELAKDEKRLCLRPEAIEVLVNNGFEILLERGAGEAAMHSDREYSEAGAKIVYSAKEAFQADIVLKVAPPTVAEIEYMKPMRTLISSFPINSVSQEIIHAINQKKITGIAFEYIEDKVGGLPIVRAMSEIAGSTVMLISAELLSSVNEGKGVILGGVTGVPPTKVVIIGAGTVAEYAARTALALGAEVKIFDNHVYKLRRIKERLGQYHIYTSAIDGVMLRDALVRADVVIGAMRSDDGRAPTVVSEEMVSRMKPNSVIIDVSIDQGGCFETSEPTNHFKPTYRKYGVIHYCVPNIASRVSRTATTAFSNIFTPILMRIIEAGSVDKMMCLNAWFAKGAYAYRGGVTKPAVGEKFNLPCKNLSLILAANI
ncbi:MAG: alanine dehydrogenase [Flammeovirgaceae bacterium]